MRTLTAILFLSTVVAFAQTKTETGDIQRVQNVALHSDYAYQFASHLTDNIGPRISGSPQYSHAAEWVAEEFKRLGLTVSTEKAMVPHWVRGEEKGELIQFPGMTPGTTQKLVLTALGPSVATPAEGISADVVVASDFDELSALGREKVKGKIVVFTAKFDQRLAAAGESREAYGQAVEYRSKAPVEAGKLGAIAVLVRSVGNAEYRLPHTGGTNYQKDTPKIPAGALASEDADLISRLARQGTVRMHLTLTPQTFPDVEGFSVIGDLKGSEHPEQIVVLSGHLDSWDLGTGAIDDAAGLAQAVDAVRIIKDLGLKPKRTLRVIAWASEEYGLQGGRAYVKAHQSELANYQAALESDLGAEHPIGVYFDGDPSIEKIMEPAMKVLQAQGASIIRLHDAGSDIIPMGVFGVPTFDPIQDARSYFNYHHTAADTLDKIEPQALRENTAVMAVVGYFLANLDQKLPQKAKPLPEWMKE